MIEIGKTKLPYPTKYLVSMSDLDSSDTTRNEEGVLVRNRLRQGVTKIELAFTIKGQEAARILDLVKPDMVSVKYFDPRQSTTRTINAYVGDRSCNLVVYHEGMTIEEMVWEVSFNLIEY